MAKKEADETQSEKVRRSTSRKRRVVKKSETVREKASKAAETKPKRHRVRKAVSQTNRPIKALWRAVKKLLKPFSPLLIPFKTRPARFVGRILAKILLINYIYNSWLELRKVEWINRRSTLKLTGAVFVFAITFSLLIAIVDYGLDKVFKALILN